MFLFRQILSSFLTLSTTNSLIEISDNILEQDFAEIQNFIFSSRRTWQVAFDATMANADFPIKNLSSRCLLVLLLSYHQLQDIQTKNCSDLSSSDIDKQKNQTGVRDAPRLYWKNVSRHFFLKRSISDVLSFLTTTSPIDTSDNFHEQDFVESQNFVFISPQHVASCHWNHKRNCWFLYRKTIQQVVFGFNTMVLSISGHKNKRTAQIYPLVIFSNKRPTNREGTPQDFNEKKTAANIFLLGQILSVFSSFLGTNSPIKTSENFPEPRKGFSEVQIFVLFSPLSGFLNFLTTNSPIGTVEMFTEQDFAEIQVSFFSPCSTDNLLWTPQSQLVIFQPKDSQQVFLVLKPKYHHSQDI